MKIFTINKRFIILSIVLFFCLSTCFQAIYADPGNGYGNDSGKGAGNGNEESNDNGNNDINQNSPGQDGTGNPNTDQGTENNDSNNNDNNSQDSTQSNNQNQNTSGDQNQGNQNQNQNKEQNQKHEGDDDGDNIDDYKERYQHRKTTITCEKNQTRISSEWQQEENHDLIEIFFSTENGLKIVFDYIPRFNTSDNDFNFEIQFKNLIEYIDMDQNGRYDESDSVVGNYSLINSIYSEINYSTIISEDGEKISVIKTSTKDDIFSIIIYVSGNYSQIQNQVVSPSEIKIDFIINNYHFLQENSFLALETEVNTVNSIDMESNTFDEKQGYGKNENELNISSGNQMGFFSWSETVLVDSIIKSVNVTVITSVEQTITDEGKEISKSSIVYFCYPQGESIVHDPKIGVVSKSYDSFMLSFLDEVISTNNIFVLLGIYLVASIIFIGTVYLRKRIH